MPNRVTHITARLPFVVGVDKERLVKGAINQALRTLPGISWVFERHGGNRVSVRYKVAISGEGHAVMHAAETLKAWLKQYEGR